MKYRCEYRYSIRFNRPLHMWILIGAKGGMHLCINDLDEDYEKKYGERYSGGIEIHYRQPPDWMKDRPPDWDECGILKCPCWHDGSSLQAEEKWIPLWQFDQHDHDGMFEALSKAADARFNQE